MPGYREGDLVLGFANSVIGTLVERTTRFTLLPHLPRITGRGHEAGVKSGPALPGKGAEAMHDTITRTIIIFPKQSCRSPTCDQGAAMALHALPRIEAGAQFYVYDPQSPWQRIAGETTNGLLCQCFPKTSISACTVPRSLRRCGRPQRPAPKDA